MTLRIRKSVQELQANYHQGETTELDNLMTAWKGIKELPADDPNSFFKIGGYHGEPFRGAGWGNASYWGGYCNHGNVLFPTWHRIYLVRLEQALQSIAGCSEVMLPYWDETDEESLQYGIPHILTDENYTYGNKTVIPNPLKSYVFPKNITDNISTDNPNYSKYKSYETVRYPLSGLVGSKEEIDATKAHNALYPNHQINTGLLNENVMNWLNSYIEVQDENDPNKTIRIPTNVNQKFKDCLNAPNFTVFSNTTSAAQWNSDHQTIDPNTGEPIDNDPYKVVVSLESPHNSIHLAVGGCEVPGYNRSPIPGANGDMGENDTAGLDPIFYFHHCNIDRVFWLWQKKYAATDRLEIIEEYPGTNTVDNQGPTPGFAPNAWLTLESPLMPFRKANNEYYTSLDSINIETQLGYTYSKGSLEDQVTGGQFKAERSYNTQVIKVSRINKAPVRGSFVVSAFANINGERVHLGSEAILSRWNSQYCANCQTHLEVKAFFELPKLGNLLSISREAIKEKIEIEIHGRNEARTLRNMSALLTTSNMPVQDFKVDLI